MLQTSTLVLSIVSVLQMAGSPDWSHRGKQERRKEGLFLGMGRNIQISGSCSILLQGASCLLSCPSLRCCSLLSRTDAARQIPWFCCWNFSAKQCWLWKEKLVSSLLVHSVLGMTKWTEHALCRKERGEMLKASYYLHPVMSSPSPKPKVQRDSSRNGEGYSFQEKEKEA